MAQDNSKPNSNKKYLENNNITKLIEEMMAKLMKEQPDDPLNFMIKFIEGKALKQGIYIPLQPRIEDDTRGELVSKSINFGRNYDKPWLSNTSKKNSISSLNKEQYVKTPNTSTIPVTESAETKFVPEEEFRLVPPPPEVDVVPTLDEIPKNKKSKRSNTKEEMLKLIEAENAKKLTEAEVVAVANTSKDAMCQEHDEALECLEHPDVYANEFNFSGAANTEVKPGPKVIVRTKTAAETEAAINCFLCTNCAKLFTLEGGRMHSSSHSTVSKVSLVLDDLESASQVNGPRPIRPSSSNPNRSKKKLSVSDFELTSKAWPVMDTSSEASGYRVTLTKPDKTDSRFLNS